MKKSLSERFEDWFKCWYEESWYSKEAQCYQEIKEIKELIKELKKREDG